MKKKTNPELAEAIFIAKKNNLTELADAISKPIRQQAKVNLTELNNVEGDSVIVAGKVLSIGTLDKKVKVYALSYSEKAAEKMPTKPGVYHVTFFERLRQIIKFFRERIEESRTWLKLMSSKKKQKG